MTVAENTLQYFSPPCERDGDLFRAGRDGLRNRFFLHRTWNISLSHPACIRWHRAFKSPLSLAALGYTVAEPLVRFKRPLRT